MNKLFKHINEIINLTLEVNVNVIDRFEVLKKLLLNIYSEYAIINIIEDDTINNIENIDFPSFDYNEIYKKVEGNFSSLGYYHSIFDIKNIYSNPGTAIGDASDDLTDIIKDFLSVKWIFENVNEEDAIYEFKLLMEIHTEAHIINLLKYLKGN